MVLGTGTENECPNPGRAEEEEEEEAAAAAELEMHVDCRLVCSHYTKDFFSGIDGYLPL